MSNKQIILGNMSPDDIETLMNQAGVGEGWTPDEASELMLWIGNITDDNGKTYFGLHAADAECPEEGSVTLVEFDRAAIVPPELNAAIRIARAYHFSETDEARQAALQELSEFAIGNCDEAVPEPIIKLLERSRDLALVEATDWKDRYIREVEGLNNEGDAIGGEPPSGMRHEVERLRVLVANLERQIAEMEAARGEPVACCYRRKPEKGEDVMPMPWMFSALAKNIDLLRERGFEAELLYTQPPAPVVVLPEICDWGYTVYSHDYEHFEHGWNTCLETLQDLNANTVPLQEFEAMKKAAAFGSEILVIHRSHDQCGVDGADIQEMAEKHGLLELKEVTGDGCGDGCYCEQGYHCYFLTDAGKYAMEKGDDK